MEILNSMIEIFNHPFFVLVGGITVVFSLVGVAYGVVCWFFGVTPFLFRLGWSLWGRKVAVFGSTDAYQNLKATLTDSGLFWESNVLHIPIQNIDKAKTQSVFVVDWESFGDHVERVFDARSSHQVPIVIFARPASIPPDKMSDIANRSNTVVVNFRGRLLNDVLTSLLTTSYEKNRS